MKKNYISNESSDKLMDDFFQGTEKTLVILRRADLIEFAETYAKRILEKQHRSEEKIEVEKPISQQEAVKFLGKSRQSLLNWRKKGIIKAHRLGGRIYYMPSELLKALRKEK